MIHRNNPGRANRNACIYIYIYYVYIYISDKPQVNDVRWRGVGLTPQPPIAMIIGIICQTTWDHAHDAHTARLTRRRLDHGGAIASNPHCKHRAARSTMSSANTSPGLHQTSASTSTRQVPQRTARTEPGAPGAEGGHTRGKNPF
jgi:hypothetical protein